MTEIAQLLESALRDNRSALLRKAAIKTVSRMPVATTLRELMQSDARVAVRELTLEDLGHALSGAITPEIVSSGGVRAADASEARSVRRITVTGADADPARRAAAQKSREEQLYRQILDVLASHPLTIGQLGKQLAIETIELRGYLSWMKRMGKINSSGRARATRYFAVI
ncbi:MAG: hypothetical protein V3V08_00485 [Nannocystaceae bacterium]